MDWARILAYVTGTVDQGKRRPRTLVEDLAVAR